MRRRTFLTGAAGSTVFLAGCSLGVGEDDDEEGEELEDEEVDALPEDVILTADDLDAGWREIERNGGSGTYVNGKDNLGVRIDIQRYDEIESADSEYQTRKHAEIEEGFGLDDVEHGNDGYLMLLDEFRGIVLFRAGNFLVEVQATSLSGADGVSVQEEANVFAEKVATKIAEAQ